MNFKQWGTELRMTFAILLGLPLIGFAVVAWFGFSVIHDLVEVSKKSIIELPAEKGVEVANVLARVHDRSEAIMFFVPLAAAVGLLTCFAFILWKLFSKLTAECTNLISSSKDISGLGEQLSQSGQSLALGASQSSAALEQSLGSVETLSSALQRTSVDVVDADRAARVAADESVRGEVELQTVVASLSELSSQSRRLEEIINVIDSIAFQTNILAVNAAVEAARAGEQGRGFAIVAEAVRNLAQHSAASAKNITVLIRESGETSKKAMNAVRSGATNLSAVVAQVRKSQLLIHKISTTTQDLTEALAGISQGLNHLDTTTRTVFHSADASPESPENIHLRIKSLQGCVNSLVAMVVSQDSVEDMGREQKPQAEHSSLAPAQSQMKKTEMKLIEKPVAQKPLQNLSSVRRTNPTEAAVKHVRSSNSPHINVGKSKPPTKLRARDVIPFEGETESEASTDVKLGSTSGF